MPGPPGLARQIPGMALKDRGAEFLRDRRDGRRNRLFNNRYGMLKDGDTGDGEPRPKRPPPIEIHGCKLGDVKKEIDKVSDVKSDIHYRICTLKLDKSVKESIKVYTNTNEDFLAVKKYLDLNNAAYNTHPLYDDKKVKICMYGLNEMPIDQIKSEITELSKIEPSEIKMIRPREANRGDSRVYILYYKKSDKIKCQQLRDAVIGLFNVRVRFEYYSPRKSGPTQCTNCMDYSHGSECCRRTARCIRCGGDHLSKNCTHLPKNITNPDEKAKIPKNLVKCCNCGGPHTANYSKCTYRLKVIQKQQYFKPPSPPAPQFKLDEWPRLDANQSQECEAQHRNVWRQADDHPPPHRATYEAMQRLLDAQQKQTEMMSQLMTQMSAMLNTINQLLSKITNSKHD